jgi:hypothetical protein
MPIDAPYGGTAKSSAPSWFTFSDYTGGPLLSALPKFDPILLFGLPNSPQQTSTF